MTCRLSRRAADDLRNILSYSRRQFGTKQTEAYKNGLEDVIRMLARYPAAGSDQSHLLEGVRRFVYRVHSIFYLQVDDGMEIVRILGPGQDPLRAVAV